MSPLRWRNNDNDFSSSSNADVTDGGLRARDNEWNIAMNENIEALVAKIKSLEGELEAELAIRRADLQYRLDGGRALFDQEILRVHRKLRVGFIRYVWNAGILHIITAPVIYSLIVPFAVLDLFITVYQSICFPVYQIEKVKRSDYLIFDRYHLAYLNTIEKMNCAYCSYCNGLVAYVREIGSRTEQYWCPIKHARRVIVAHERYNLFADYGDAVTFRRKVDLHVVPISEAPEPPDASV